MRLALVFALLAGLAAAAAAPAQTPPSSPSRAEITAIQQKISRAWVPPAGADVRGLLIDLRVALDRDGTVLAVQTVDQARVARDDLFRRAAASAEAAVWRASPLPVPRDKAAFFKQFVLRFAPPEA